MYHSRRSFLQIASALAVAFPTVGVSEPSASAVPYADKAAADKWLKSWMQSFKAANKPLHLGRFADPMYYLLDPIDWTPNAGQEVKGVSVPVGFVTDFASIPRTFWTLLRPDGLYTYPAILHDYLYWEQPVHREEADMVLKFAMEEFRVPAATVKTIYGGVRLGGQGAWDENAKLKASGEKRILKSTPTDPKIQWSEWKTRPGVFG